MSPKLEFLSSVLSVAARRIVGRVPHEVGEGHAAACTVALAGIREGIQVLLFLAIAAGEGHRQGTHHRANDISSEGSITETEFFRNKGIGESLDSACPAVVF